MGRTADAFPELLGEYRSHVARDGTSKMDTSLLELLSDIQSPCSRRYGDNVVVEIIDEPRVAGRVPSPMDRRSGRGTASSGGVDNDECPAIAYTTLRRKA